MSQLLEATELVRLVAGWEHRRGPRYLALADAIADTAMREEMEDGTRLPPERTLAQLAAVGRGTVVAAYAELADRGLVERRQGSGTRLVTGIAPTPARALRSELFARTVQDEDELIDMSFGSPFYDEHVAAFHAGAADAIAMGAPRRGYAPLGLPGLREAIAQRLTARDTPTTSTQIIVTNGAQGALQLLTTALVRRGDRVVVEAPTYPGAIELFSRAGAVIVPVRRDSGGARMDDLARALGGPGAALVFLVPTCAYPTGAVTSEARRREILAMCAEHEVLLVEDGTPADLVFTGTTPPTMTSMAPDRIVSVGSFSKVMWGGMRTGWLRADPSLVLRLGRLKAAQDLGGGLLDQAAVFAALPRFDELAALRRAQAAEHQGVLEAAITALLPSWHLHETKGGWSQWVRLPVPRGDELVAAAARRGVAIASGTSTAPDDLFLDHIRLCYPESPPMLEEAARRLALAWDDLGEER